MNLVTKQEKEKTSIFWATEIKQVYLEKVRSGWTAVLLVWTNLNYFREISVKDSDFKRELFLEGDCSWTMVSHD